MKIGKIIVVTRPTRLESSIRRFNTKSQVKFYIESRGQSFDDYELEYNNYHNARDFILQALQGLRVQIIDWSFLPNFIFGPTDIVLTIGQDGLVVNTAKYLNGQPILAFNPDPARFDGILLPFTFDQANNVLEKLQAQQLTQKKISMAKVQMNDGQSMLAFNDFYIGASSHISSRYSIEFNQKKERQSSSGIIVSTPAGSTGWLSSLYNMSSGMQKSLGSDQLVAPQPMNWQDRQLRFVVREPFRSKWSGADMITGLIEENNSLHIESHMAQKGVIFSDGMENDFIEFTSGSSAVVTLATKQTHLLSWADV